MFLKTKSKFSVQGFCGKNDICITKLFDGFLHRLTSTCTLFSVQKNMSNGNGYRNRYNLLDHGHKKKTVVLVSDRTAAPL